MSEDKINCFVIMPFTDTTPEHTEKYWTEHYENFLKPLIEEVPNISAHRSEALRGDILKQIINDIVFSPIVVADLTDKNVNVFWELGVRQSFKHGTITIAEEGTELPFDIFGKGTIFYNPKNHVEMVNFNIKFKVAIKDYLFHPDRPDSHVLETLSGRGTIFEIFQRDEATRRLDAVLSECERNLNIHTKISQQVRSNQENKDKRKISPLHFNKMAIDLLVATRYIDEDQKFFELVENYTGILNAFNSVLFHWQTSPDAAEKYILETEEEIKKEIKCLKSIVEASYEKVSKLL